MAWRGWGAILVPLGVAVVLVGLSALLAGVGDVMLDRVQDPAALLVAVLLGLAIASIGGLLVLVGARLYRGGHVGAPIPEGVRAGVGVLAGLVLLAMGGERAVEIANEFEERTCGDGECDPYGVGDLFVPSPRAMRVSWAMNVFAVVAGALFMAGGLVIAWRAARAPGSRPAPP